MLFRSRSDFMAGAGAAMPELPTPAFAEGAVDAAPPTLGPAVDAGRSPFVTGAGMGRARSEPDGWGAETGGVPDAGNISAAWQMSPADDHLPLVLDTPMGAARQAGAWGGPLWEDPPGTGVPVDGQIVPEAAAVVGGDRARGSVRDRKSVV